MRDFSNPLVLNNCNYDSWTGVAKLWLRLTFNLSPTKNCHHDLPCSSVGKDFVDQLFSGIGLHARSSKQSEKVLVFLSTVLQQDTVVWKSTDIV